MLGQKNWLVILVSRNTLQLIGLGEEKVETVTIPESIINNMEVLNKDGLYTLITEWLKLRPHIGAEIIWLLAPEVCFEHVLTSSEQDKVDSETLQFLDTVPFEEVIHRVYKPLEWRLIVAVNKELITSLIQGFALHGHITRAVVPSRIVQADATLTREIENNTLKRLNELIRESIVSANLPSDNFTGSQSQQSSQVGQSKSSLPLLLGVFGVLLAVLLGVLLFSNR